MPTPRTELTRLRRAEARSVRDQANRIGISRTTLSNVERGDPVLYPTIRRIAAYYGKPAAELFPELLEEPALPQAS